MSYTLIDKTKRSILHEGRSQGLGSAFAAHKDGVLTMIDPISCCKDYCSDRSASEIGGYVGTNHGLHTKPEGIFKDGLAYLVIGVLPAGAITPKPYAGMDKDIAALEANHKHVERMIQWFEEQIKVTGRTVVEKVETNRFVVILPLFWVEATYRISLLGLILRNAMYWTGAPDPIEYLKTLETSDRYHLTTALQKVEYMIKHGAPTQDMKAFAYSPHSVGIVNYPFPPDPNAVVAAPTPMAAPTVVPAALTPIITPTKPPQMPIVQTLKAMKVRKAAAKTVAPIPAGAPTVPASI